MIHPNSKESLESDPIKTYDARWQIDEFDDEKVRRLIVSALTYGAENGADRVTIGRDGRTHAGRIAQTVVDCAIEAGFETWYTPGPVSTPMSYFTTLLATVDHPGTMGITVTASHNPSDYIGIKLVIPPVQAVGLDCGPAGGLTRVREIYRARPRPRVLPGPRGRLVLTNRVDSYLDACMKLSGSKPGCLDGTRVVVDAMNGSAGSELYAVLQEAGADVDAVDIVADGTFPRGAPNPTSIGKLADSIGRAAARDAFLIGLDGDGDRIVFGDGRGTLEAGFASIPILASWKRTHTAESNTIALFDPKVSPVATAEWQRLGFTPRMIRNGHSQIKNHMRARGIAFAGEESGHYYHAIDRSGLVGYMECTAMTAMLFLRHATESPESIDDAWSLQKQVCSSGEMNFRFESDGIRDMAMDSILQYFRNEGATVQTTSDDGSDLGGARVVRGAVGEAAESQTDAAWYTGFVRPSTNEKSTLRVFVSSNSEAEEQRHESEIREAFADRFHGQVVE